MRSHLWDLALFLCVSASTVACSDEDTRAADDVTYHRDAAPVLARYCTGCHAPDGIAPFSLDGYGNAARYADQTRAAVQAGTMPPWLASDAGLPLRYSHRMRPQDRDLLLRWIDKGMAEGDPQAPARSDIPPPETVAPPRPDLRLQAEDSYVPNAKVPDDYRCFVVHSELPQDLYVQAVAIHPDQTKLVHHVVLFEVPTPGVAKVRALLGKDGQVGYSCFGGAGADDSARVVMAWAPGGVPARFPVGTALKVSQGSLLVMQVHYNLQGGARPDRTRAEMEVSPLPPSRLAQIWPVANPRGLYIKAGDPAARQTIELPVWQLQAYYGFPAGNLLLHGSAPHMHLLGRRQTVAVADGPLLLEIPRWDFNWQLPYQFATPYELRPQDTIVISCEFDNSAGHQPVVAGQRQPPRDVRWGEGTTDEMCLNFLYVAPL